MALGTIDTGIYSGEIAGEKYPGLQGLIDAMTKRNKGFKGSMMHLTGKTSKSKIRKLAMQLMGYGPKQKAGGPLGGFGKWGIGQGGGLGKLSDWAGGGGGLGKLFGGGLFGKKKKKMTALQKALAAKKAGFAKQKLGLMRGGSSGTVTSNITD